MTDEYRHWCELAREAASAAEVAIRPYFRNRFDVQYKADDSPVTVADEAAEQVIRQIIQADQRRNLTVFFSDIVGFTELTDTVEPEMLSQMLNSYLDEMASICDKWGGTIDKFIGDAVMIYFGDEEQSDPVDGARRCVCMASIWRSSRWRCRSSWMTSSC